jgi:hypothetical protein
MDYKGIVSRRGRRRNDQVHVSHVLMSSLRLACTDGSTSIVSLGVVEWEKKHSRK